MNVYCLACGVFFEKNEKLVQVKTSRGIIGYVHKACFDTEDTYTKTGKTYSLLEMEKKCRIAPEVTRGVQIPESAIERYEPLNTRSHKRHRERNKAPKTGTDGKVLMRECAWCHTQFVVMEHKQKYCSRLHAKKASYKYVKRGGGKWA